MPVFVLRPLPVRRVQCLVALLVNWSASLLVPEEHVVVAVSVGGASPLNVTLPDFLYTSRAILSQILGRQYVQLATTQRFLRARRHAAVAKFVPSQNGARRATSRLC